MPMVQDANGNPVYVSQDEYERMYRERYQTQARPTQGSGLGGAAGLAVLGDQLGLFGGGEAAAASAPFEVGSALNGGTLLSDGTVAGGGFLNGGLVGGGAGSVSTYIPAAIGAYGLYDLFKNKKHGWGGALQGGASGAAIGTTIAPGIGTLIGAGVGAGVGYFGNLGDKDAFQTEYKRAQALRDKGIDWKLNAEKPAQGRSIDELVALENEKVKAGQYGNPTFAASRNEADLKPQDITGYAAFGEKFGKDWMGTTEASRNAIAQQILNAGGVREHHGTIDINFTPELEKFAADTFAKPLADAPKPTVPGTNAPGTQNRPSTYTKPLPPPPPSFNLQPQQQQGYRRSPYNVFGGPMSFQNMIQTMNQRRRAYA